MPHIPHEVAAFIAGANSVTAISCLLKKEYILGIFNAFFAILAIVWLVLAR